MKQEEGGRVADRDELVVRELEHRFKNILTIVRAIVSQSLGAASSIEDARDVIDERLASLGGAVEQLLSSDWKAAPLPALADQALAHLSFYTERVSFLGETVEIGPRAAMTLTLAFHELATNAIKYGALSNETGTVELCCRVRGAGDDAELLLQWIERGGPPVTRPERQGFGTRLICTATGRSLQGSAMLDFPAIGAVWTLVAPLTSVRF